MRVRIAARQSDLARIQAQTVGHELNLHGANVDFSFRESLGDINLHDPLWRMPEKGVFTEDFLKDLIEGRADMVVHSWKDLPTEIRTQTDIVATLPRADLRDLFLFRKDRRERVCTSKTLKVLTSSPRRAHNLDPFFKSQLPFSVERVEFSSVRGNVPTRIRKLFSEDADGLVVAKAALDRLLETESGEYDGVRSDLREHLDKCLWMVLPVSMNPTAAAQGALAIEIRRDRTDLRDLLAKINCAATFACVTEERRILAAFGGGCHQKIGVSVFDRSFGRVLSLQGLTDAGERLDRFELIQSHDQTPQPTSKPTGATANKPKNKDAIWPTPGVEDERLFTREPLARDVWSPRLNLASFVWISRETALPQEATLRETQIVWCAGLKTWRKLASRGIWVNGTSEGLGEREETRIETLCGLKKNERLKWLKLTHDLSASTASNDTDLLATYRLVPVASVPDFAGKTHFYWMSGTAFDRAVELRPSVKDAFHACGPGLTYDHLRARLGNETPIQIALSREAWLDWAVGEK